MAITFNGTSQNINLGTDLNLFNGVSAFSMMAWIKPRVDQGNRHIFSISVGPPPGVGNIHRGTLRVVATNIFEATVRNADSDGASNITTAAAVFTSGAWQHIGFSYNCNSKLALLYVNGAQVQSGTASSATGTTTSATNSKCAAIGCRANTGLFFDGDIEDCRAYSRWIGADEFMTIFSLSGRDNIVDGLQGRWLMQELAEGETVVAVADLSPAGIRGTPVSSPVYALGRVLPRKRPQSYVGSG